MAAANIPFSNNAPPANDPRVRQLSPEQVNDLVNAPKTVRQRELEYLQAVSEGHQYKGRPPFWNDDVPVQEREPCIQYDLCAQAIESNASFAMGEGRFPKISSHPDEDDELDDDLGLNEDESKVMDPFNARLIDLSDLEQAFENAYKMAQASRSVAIVLGYRSGLPFADLIWSKLCTPTFGDPTDPYRVTRLEIRYRYTEKWRDPQLTGGEWWVRVKEYLRVIDATYDTLYWPVSVWETKDPGVEEGRSAVQARVAHGFGLCPVHWYARKRVSVVGDNPDGKAVHEGATCGLLEQLDLALSQRHRAAVYAGDPQTVVTGVSPNDTIGNTGRKTIWMPNVHPLDQGTRKGPMFQAMYGGGSSGGSALRRGVAEVWRIENVGAKVDLLVLPAGALGGLTEDAKECARIACENLGIVIIDPATFSGAGDLSGRTLAFLFSRQINRVSTDRKDLTRRCILPVLNLFYRMLLAQSDGVYLPGLTKVLPILKRFYKTVGAGPQDEAVAAAVPEGAPQQAKPAPAKIWFCPKLKLVWGDFFEVSDTDKLAIVQTATAAKEAGVITKATAVSAMRRVYPDIGDVSQYVDALDDEAQEKRQQLMEDMHAMGGGGAEGPPGAQQQLPFVKKPKPPKPGAKKQPRGTPPKPDGT